MEIVVRRVRLLANPCNVCKQVLVDIISERLRRSDLIIGRGVESERFVCNIKNLRCDVNEAVVAEKKAEGEYLTLVLTAGSTLKDE